MSTRGASRDPRAAGGRAAACGDEDVVVARCMHPTMLVDARESDSYVLICDDDAVAAELLALELEELGHSVLIVRSCADAFSAACAQDFDALLCAPFLRDGSTIALPHALGLRRPRFVALTSKVGERLARAVARRVGFDTQLTKIIDAGRVDGLIRAAKSAVEAGAVGESAPPVSRVAARGRAES